MNDRRGFFF